MSYFLESRPRRYLFRRIAGENQTTGGAIHQAQARGSRHYSFETLMYFIDHMRHPACNIALRPHIVNLDSKINIYHYG
jgi:hypothetical protein